MLTAFSVVVQRAEIVFFNHLHLLFDAKNEEGNIQSN